MTLAMTLYIRWSYYYTPTGFIEAVRDDVALLEVSHGEDLICCVVLCKVKEYASLEEF